MKRRKSSYYKIILFDKTMNIGILGGTFDPIHKGHIGIAEQAYQQFSLDEIWFLPNGNPPHKSQDSIGATAQQRLEMTEGISSSKEYYKTIDYEVRRTEISYSYETLAFLRATYPNNTFYFIVGADSLFALEKWKNTELFLNECILIATYREGIYNKDDIQQKIDTLTRKYKANIRLLEMPLIPISSHKVREYVRVGMCEDVKQYLFADTLAYIEKYDLYKGNAMQKLEDIKLDLEQALPQKRYDHSIGVMYTAAALAMHYNVNIDDAMLAGLLHDGAKQLSLEEMLDLSKKQDVMISVFEEKNLELLHSKIGAILAETKYNVKNSYILEAIRCHTTGKPNMSTLDKIIFLADFIEPGRKNFPGLDTIRTSTFKNLDQGMALALKHSLNYLKKQQIEIDKMTIDAYQYYKNRE